MVRICRGCRRCVPTVFITGARGRCTRGRMGVHPVGSRRACVGADALPRCRSPGRGRPGGGVSACVGAVREVAGDLRHFVVGELRQGSDLGRWPRDREAGH
jgi:hypothetical protein